MDEIKKLSAQKTNILIIDDFFMVSLLAGSRDCKRIRQFLRKSSQHVDKMFIFSHKETINPSETGVVYDVASAIAVLSASQSKYFVCDLLKIKPERRVTHEV
jgi:hypothetical protein